MREHFALATLGLAILTGLSVLLWLRRPVAFKMEAAAVSDQPVWDQALLRARTVNLNTASVEDLERLPRIGPALASRIVQARAQRGGFASPQELLEIPGIGPATLEALLPSLVAE
jgi:competence ComEA-like helix-hairpin-helix protein